MKKGRKIPNVFARALRLDVLTDVVIKVGASDKSIRAHRCVLGARSAVLERMFVNSEKKKEQPTTINIPDMSFEVCQALISYLYDHIEEEELRKYICELLDAAKAYEIADLKKACEEILQNGVMQLSI